MREVNLINSKEKIRKTLLFFTFYMSLGIFILIKLPVNIEGNDFFVYLTLVITYFSIGGLLLLSYITRGLDLLEPIVFVSLIYLMLFVFTPLINIVYQETLWFNIDLMDGGLKATIIFLVSYLAFYIGYYKPKTRRKQNRSTKIIIKGSSIKYILLTNMLIWLFCFACSIGYLISNGMSISYTLSLGARGIVNENTNSSFAFLNMFSYSLIPTFMYIFVYSKNKLIKIILGVLTSIVFILNGFRFILLIFMLAPLIYCYIEKNRRPKILSLSVVSIILVAMTALIGFTRDHLRGGQGINFEGFNMDSIVYSIKGNFDIYNTFYGAVKAIPELHPYTMGEQIAYTFIMFIPRFLWPSKPEPITNDLIAVSVSNYANQAGTAWPNLGEYYTEFGVIGCVIIMFIFGWICGKSKLLYLNNNGDTHSLIGYAILLPALFQIIIRGYTPSNFYLIIFLLLPVLISKKIIREKIRKN